MTNARNRLLRGLHAASPGETAIRFQDRGLSFGEWRSRARAYATRLGAMGIRAGDRVVVYADRSPEVLIALVGHHLAGVIHVPINPRYKGQEAEHILGDCEPSAILVDAAQATRLDELGLAPEVPRIWFGGAPADELGFDTLSAPAAPATECLPGPESFDDEATAIIIYTSGTTGPSKGVELSFRALVEGIGRLTRAWGFSPDDRLVLALPLFHVHGLCIGVHGALIHGLSLVLLPRFEASTVVAEMREASIFMGVPTMYSALLEHLEAQPADAANLRAARLFTSGSAALLASDHGRFEELTGKSILERYGMTETLLTVSNPLDGERKAGTIGFPLADCRTRIVDDDGADCRPGESGELWVRWPGVMSRYWGRPEATTRAFTDGWFRTGDVMVAEPDGRLRVVGRQSVDILKCGGFKISAREIEDVLAEHPLVRECAVIGAPDPKWGQRIIAAAVVSKAAASLDDEALLTLLGEHVVSKLADYKRPRGLLRMERLPRNAMGKLQKHEIAALLRS